MGTSSKLGEFHLARWFTVMNMEGGNLDERRLRSLRP